MIPDQQEVRAFAESLDRFAEALDRLGVPPGSPIDDAAIGVAQAGRRLLLILGLTDAPAPAAKQRPVPPPPMRSATGAACGECGSFNVIRTGTCATCQDCGRNEGCS